MSNVNVEQGLNIKSQVINENDTFANIFTWNLLSFLDELHFYCLLSFEPKS